MFFGDSCCNFIFVDISLRHVRGISLSKAEEHDLFMKSKISASRRLLVTGSNRLQLMHILPVMYTWWHHRMASFTKQDVRSMQKCSNTHTKHTSAICVFITPCVASFCFSSFRCAHQKKNLIINNKKRETRACRRQRVAKRREKNSTSHIFFFFCSVLRET
jgi:hypothetical protein